MAAGESNIFDDWLSAELVKFSEEVDLEVYVGYIKGILDSETGEDLKESLFETVSQFKPEQDDLSRELCEKVILKWQEEEEKKNEAIQQEPKEIGVNMHDIISLNLKDSTLHHSSKPSTHKDAILKNYGHVSSGEECEEETETNKDDNTGGKTHKQASDEKLLVKNTNAQEVKNREKEMRERSRKDTEVRKLKDKEDREKQKQKEKDRKEGEKKRTQKGEKRRG